MRERTTVQNLALLVGAAFLAVGVLGFVPGITTHYGDLSFGGHGGDAELLGIFAVSILHNLVHLAFGIVGIALAKAPDSAQTFLLGGGIVYLLVWLVGVIGIGGFIPVNTADNWLHLVLGASMIALGSVAGRAVARPAPA